mgnify:CR=1 FL=1|jgi:hypothetical protein|tara:strand:+ start:404 stop:640 length:237 start_codon:yes stop_codon:yes gene_type:complete
MLNLRILERVHALLDKAIQCQWAVDGEVSMHQALCPSDYRLRLSRLIDSWLPLQLLTQFVRPVFKRATFGLSSEGHPE